MNRKSNPVERAFARSTWHIDPHDPTIRRQAFRPLNEYSRPLETAGHEAPQQPVRARVTGSTDSGKTSRLGSVQSCWRCPNVQEAGLAYCDACGANLKES